MAHEATFAFDDETFRVCELPPDQSAHRIRVTISLETPTGVREKSVDVNAENIAVILYLLERDMSKGSKARFLRSTFGLSMHELAYWIGEPDQHLVVARERGEESFTGEQLRKLKATIVGILPVEYRGRLRSMALRTTAEERERIMYWIR